MGRGFHGKNKKAKGSRVRSTGSDLDCEEWVTSTSHHSGYYSRKVTSSRNGGSLVKRNPKRQPQFDPVHDNPTLRSFRNNRMCEHHDQFNLGQAKRGKTQITKKPFNLAPRSSNPNQNKKKDQNRPPKIYNSAHPNSYKTAWVQANSQVAYDYVNSSDEEVNSDFIDGEPLQPQILTQVERVPIDGITTNLDDISTHDGFLGNADNSPDCMDGLFDNQESRPSVKHKAVFSYPEASEESFKTDGFYIDTVGNQEYSPEPQNTQETVSSYSKKIELPLEPIVIDLVSEEQVRGSPENTTELTQKKPSLSKKKANVKIANNDELLQDYIDSMDVEDLNLKLSECRFLVDKTDETEYLMGDSGDESGNTSYDEHMIHASDFESGSGSGSDLSESEEYYRGFNEGVSEGLSFFLKNLTTNQRRKMEHLIRINFPPEMRPVCLDGTTPHSNYSQEKPPSAKPNKNNVKLNNYNPDVSQPVMEMANADLSEANAAILEMLRNKHRKAILFPTQSKAHFQSIRALSLAYNLRVFQTATSAGSQIRAEKIKASRVPRDQSDINQLLGLSISIKKSTGSKFTKSIKRSTTKYSEIKVSSGAPIPSTNMGHKLLSKMGWAPGQALGASGTGILEPILPEVRKKNQGLGA